jgi:hypothetical protein
MREMAKDWDWQEAKATYKDVDGDEHETSVTYAEVTSDFAGREVPTLTGVTVVREGDVVVQNPGDNAGRYDVLAADAWKNSYGGSQDASTDRGVDRNAGTGGTDKTTATRR